MTKHDYMENTNESKQLTFGEKLVGLEFNPSNDDAVAKVKKICAELADIALNHYYSKPIKTELDGRIFNHTVGEILNAQMNVVKLLTFKY